MVSSPWVANGRAEVLQLHPVLEACSLPAGRQGRCYMLREFLDDLAFP